jgi:ATP-dependent RNA helicase SUPV3L1/SUV3
MKETQKLIRLYREQYEQLDFKKTAKKLRYSDFGKSVKQLTMSVSTARQAQGKSAVIENYHRQIKNIYCYARYKHREDTQKLVRDKIIPRLVALEWNGLSEELRTGIDAGFYDFLRKEVPGDICTQALASLLSSYIHDSLTGKILELVPTRPEMEFPETLEMQRHFILHIGPTNSGKTFQSLERLKEAEHGLYLGPLRLLALEVYERLHEAGVPSTMLTGQECMEDPDSRVTASTIEMADYDQLYDIAVIDEAQMMADAERGHSWTRAILGIRAREIHICTSPTAEQVLLHLIDLCHDTCEIRRYERKTALICEDQPFQFPEDLQDGDALIVFSKRAVMDVAGRLEAQNIDASVIYGSLPPEIRRRQMHLFGSGKTKVVVATDAIGMGLNLPVRRIVFVQTEKFDGTRRRPLNVSEIKQIAGRAGRYGIYDTGYINAMGEDSLPYIRERYEAEEPQIEKVRLGFPQVLLDLEEPLDRILQVWYSVAPTEPFEKENIEEILYLYERASKNRELIDGFEDKHTLYRMISCPIDIKDSEVVRLWLEYCKTYSADISLAHPRLGGLGLRGLARYETYYKQLDLYYQFSQRFGKQIDESWLAREREKTESMIMRYLTRGKEDYISRCPYCARPLPLGYPYRVCERCYNEQ